MDIYKISERYLNKNEYLEDFTMDIYKISVRYLIKANIWRILL